MVRHLALFYRPLLNDYVVNEKGDMFCDHHCRVFPGQKEAVDYILETYS